MKVGRRKEIDKKLKVYIRNYKFKHQYVITKLLDVSRKNGYYTLLITIRYYCNELHYYHRNRN